MSFTVLGAPDLNGVLHTKRIIWSVIWTLRYEWLFYLSLPLMSLCLRAAVSARYVVLSIVLVAGFVVCGVREVRWLAAFGGGIAASFVVRSEGFRLLAKTRVASAIVLGCLGSTFCFLPTGFSRATLLVLTIAFSLIAGGSTMFGVFVWPASRMLGAMCYSMYLLHGLLLYSVFQLGLGLERAGRLSPVQHWLVVCACVPVLVALCFMTFRLIEAPGMRSAGPVAAKLRDFMRRWRTAFGSRPVRRVNVSGTKLSAQPVAVALSAADGADAARTTGDPVL
jgi:peptidoglycan/LPS O-acetylase OafA/YrhL